MNISKCPYCKKELKKIPKRKTKCSNCGKEMYVRSGEIVSEKQKILIDSKKRLEHLWIPGLSSANSLDDLWGVLNKGILLFSQKGDFHTVSSIYLEMGMITYAERKYKHCITFYMLCSHFGAYQELTDWYTGLDLDSLMATENYMDTSPVQDSLKKLKLKNIDEERLGKLSVSQEFSVREKRKILEEIFQGNLSTFNALEFNQNQRLRKNRSIKKTQGLKTPNFQKKVGGLGKNSWNSLTPKKKDGCFMILLKISLLSLLLFFCIALFPTLIGIGISHFIVDRIKFKNKGNKLAVKIIVIALAVIINLIMLASNS